MWHPEADPVYMAAGKTVLDDEKATASGMPPPREDPLRAMFDGGNCRQIEHPPFTFAPVAYAPGVLQAVGYNRGKLVVADVRHTPGQPAALSLVADLENRPLAADGADAVFIRATVSDAKGNPVPGATNAVDFIVSGGAQLMSPSRVEAEAGIATALIRARDVTAGRVVLSATSPGLKSSRFELNSTPSREHEPPVTGR